MDTEFVVESRYNNCFIQFCENQRKHLVGFFFFGSQSQSFFFLIDFVDIEIGLL